jgi:SAM-dependent methyltransferase
MDQAWIDFFDPNHDGIVEHPYGDLYRMWLINPTVVQVALGAARKKAGEADLTSLDLGLAVQGQCFSQDFRQGLQLEKLERWHADLLKEIGDWRPFKDLTILDLGCGVGYLAPILTGLGADYYGVDRSTELVRRAAAWWSSSCNKRASFLECDLDSIPAEPVGAADKLRALCGGRVPDLVLAINCVEYLRKPELLLCAVRHLLAPKYATASAFFVSINPDYYVQLRHQQTVERPFLREPAEIMIACLNRAVAIEECNLLGRFKLCELLRDGGFVILQEGFLSVPPGGDAELKRHYEHGCEAVNLGLAPFISFAVNPLPVGRRPAETEWGQIRSRSVLRYLEDSDSRSHDPRLLKRIRAEGVVITLQKSERLLARHNLGGRLYIVVKGQFCAPVAPENVFKPYDLFGELEANFCIEPSGVRYGYYVNDVVAMEDGSAVFVIPTPLATELVGPRSSLRAELFAKLRDNVMLRNARLTLRAAREKPLYKASPKWEEFGGVNQRHKLSSRASGFFFPSISGNPFSQIKNFGKYELGRVAGALLELQEIEHRVFRRCSSAHCVLVDTKTLRKIADLTDDDINMYIRALHWLGTIDAFVPAGTICGAEVAAVVGQHFKGLVRGNADWERATKNAIDRWTGHAHSKSFWSGKEPSDDPMTAKFHDVVDQYREQRADGNAFCDLLRQALTALAHVNYLLFDKTPNFFIVRDLPLLRSLAYDPEPVLNRNLFARASSLCRGAEQIGSPLPPLEKLAEKARDTGTLGRLQFYGAALCQFIATDIERYSGALCYSTGVATHHVPTVPE